MTARFAVITRVADPSTGGNMAMGDVWLDPQATGGRPGDEHSRLVDALGLPPMVVLYLRLPVFRVGEILVMDHNDRDQFGRKPDKWDVDVETFDDIDAAAARAVAVADGAS